MHTHVYMKRVDGAQAGATQIQINLSGELNVFRVQVKVKEVYNRDFWLLATNF